MVDKGEPINLKGYELRERIGAGGFGAVYRAYQSTVGREVAVKVILPGLANQPEFIRRFEAEAQIVARLEHPHIVPLHDYWRDPQGAYLVMRWLRGGSLQNVLQKGAYDLHAALLLLDHIAAALSLAHRSQVIHRDIKPSNILLDEDGNAYLTDFGIAKDLNEAGNNTQPDAIVGSLDYISPEQARSEAVTHRTDIYSLGVRVSVPLTRHIIRFGIPLPAAPATDLRNPDKAQLRADILAMLQQGMSYRKIGAELDIHWTRVGQIVRSQPVQCLG